MPILYLTFRTTHGLKHTVCVCVCVCVYIHIYILCVCVYTHTHTHTQIYKYICDLFYDDVSSTHYV
jgi:hypothetical protein